MGNHKYGIMHEGYGFEPVEYGVDSAILAEAAQREEYIRERARNESALRRKRIESWLAAWPRKPGRAWRREAIEADRIHYFKTHDPWALN